ncbi:cytochrome c [Oricola sp.]|uniref:c-type cytochrome n=1 Tax=Oricola sp. TaxID=1979950 RepID=UPI0025F764DC|nr:cytochrome c [Oricola sp.]MCI5076339.1 cytochrome c [Oricola sp.]
MRNARTIGLAVAVAVVATTGLAMAHSNASGVVKQRMDAMKDIAEQMKTIGLMIRGQNAFDAAAAADAADTVAQHAATIPSLFPEGSLDSPTEALPAIWADWDQFNKNAADLQSAAADLSSSAAGAAEAADIRTQFAVVGATCSSCHEDFRKAE